VRLPAATPRFATERALVGLAGEGRRVLRADDAAHLRRGFVDGFALEMRAARLGAQS